LSSFIFLIFAGYYSLHREALQWPKSNSYRKMFILWQRSHQSAVKRGDKFMYRRNQCYNSRTKWL